MMYRAFSSTNSFLFAVVSREHIHAQHVMSKHCAMPHEATRAHDLWNRTVCHCYVRTIRLELIHYDTRPIGVLSLNLKGEA